MSDTMAEKVYCYEPMNCKDNSALWAALMNKDNSAEYAMMNSWNNNPFIWLIWMMFFRNGWNGDGMGESYNSRSIATLQDTINTNHNNDLVLQGIHGNASAITELASTFGTSNAIMQGAINEVKNAVDRVAATSGITGERVINSVILGNKDLTSALQSCCCENKLLVTQMGYEGQIRDLQNTSNILGRIEQLANGVTQGFSATAYETAQLTCALQNTVKDLTQTIMNKLSSMEANAQQDKINNLTAQLTAANSRAERAAELAPIYNQLNAIKSAQPATTTIQYPQLTVVPNYLGNTSYTNGFWG